MTNKNFYRKTMTLTYHYLAIEILTKAFTGCEKVL